MSKNFQRCFLYFIKLERYTVHSVYACVVHLSRCDLFYTVHCEKSAQNKISKTLMLVFNDVSIHSGFFFFIYKSVTGI